MLLEILFAIPQAFIIFMFLYVIRNIFRHAKYALKYTDQKLSNTDMLVTGIFLSLIIALFLI